MTNKFLFSFFLIFGFLFFSNYANASVWTISSENSYTTQSGSATLISGISIIGGAGSDIIPVKLRSTSGTLSMSITTGLTFTGPSSGTTIYFSGTRNNLNTALATLTYNRAGTGSDTLEMSLVEYGEVFFEDNGHLYKFISGNINAITARTAATGLTAYGATGYLATITSQAENDFVAARLQGDGWIAGSDEVSEGVWKWVAGPETGDTFWNGASGGSSPPGQYANWSTGEPNDWLNGTPGEDCVQFYISNTKWNDLNCNNTLSGYVAEFGAPGDLPEVEAKNMAITTVSAPVISTLSPFDNATNINTTANLVITFSQNVTVDTGNILIKKTSDDSLVESINLAGDKVTGSGSAIITINPGVVLDDLISYYIEIPGTAFKNASDVYFAGISSKTTWNFTTGDYNSPVLAEVTPIGVVVNNNTPSYNFSSTEAGSITYGGSCTSTTTEATVGNNTIVLNFLAVGTYADCTIMVTDDFDHDSNILAISSFSLVVHSGGSSSPQIPISVVIQNTEPVTPIIPINNTPEVNTEPETSNTNLVNTYISPVDNEVKACPGFTKYLRKGNKSNDKNEVILWQSFLNKFYNTNLKVDGIYGNNTEKAIKDFQNKYKEYVLLPWNLNTPTGYTYQTTQSYANKILGCLIGPIVLDNGKTINF